MKKMFLKKDDGNRYHSLNIFDKEFATRNVIVKDKQEMIYGYGFCYNDALDILLMGLHDNSQFREAHNIVVDDIKRYKKVWIWSRENIKTDALSDDIYSVENYERYEQYEAKRWDEIPKIEMSISDWQELKARWKEVKNLRPPYIMLELDDSGSLDKVQVTALDSLSEDDLEYTMTSILHCIKYKQAWYAYASNLINYNQEHWQCAQDDEYEADIMRYYEFDSEEEKVTYEKDVARRQWRAQLRKKYIYDYENRNWWQRLVDSIKQYMQQ